MPLINWHSFFFLLFALLTCGFALAVVLSGNIVRMASYLVASLGAVAGLFFLAGADFVGTVQLMVYVGGTLVLLAFGVMLTARSPFISIETSGGQWVIAALVGASLLAVLLQSAFSVRGFDTPKAVSEAAMPPPAELPPTATSLGLGLLGVRTDSVDRSGAVRPGTAGYLLPFEIISVHLLVVLVGAAYLARSKRRVRE